MCRVTSGDNKINSSTWFKSLCTSHFKVKAFVFLFLFADGKTKVNGVQADKKEGMDKIPTEERDGVKKEVHQKDLQGKG